MCKHIAKRQGCGARKLIDYNPKTKIAVVFHIGKHKCWKRFDDSHIIAAHHEKKKAKPRSGPAKDMAIDDIVEVLDDPECTISDVEKRHNGISLPGQIHFQNWKHTLSLAKRMFEAS